MKKIESSIKSFQMDFTHQGLLLTIELKDLVGKQLKVETFRDSLFIHYLKFLNNEFQIKSLDLKLPFDCVLTSDIEVSDGVLKVRLVRKFKHFKAI